ncbi:ABC transporter permease [Paenibacillus dokdonensis]|uniref:ABC transporter permease n=1 Tax=Paenibacillus dokdonensis TaxID=2567944 RepID=A0ABU6GS67_9BACL|nr:ABC transporter permease [Paenibacillus dokdonensis]MEC0240997.1 ABC transporter permease [Paenibacillus dokdonensis]
MWNDIWFLVRMTMLTTFRKRGNLLLYFGLPIVGVLVASMLYGSQSTPDLRVGVVNEDGNQVIAADTIRFVQGLSHVKLVNTTKEDLKKSIAASKLDTGIILDAGYSSSVLKGKAEHISIESVKGAQVTAYIKSMLYGYIDNVTAMGTIAAGDTGKFQQLYDAYQVGQFKLTAESVNDKSSGQQMSYQSIGFLIMFMMTSAVNLSQLILKNRENRTYFRILTSPISSRTYVLSNVIVNLIVMIIQITVALFFMKVVFRIDAGIPVGEMVFILGLFALVSVSISLAIVSFSKSTAAAGALQNLIVTPTCLISGCFFPRSIMPEALRKLSDFMPQNWVLESLGKLQAGEALSSIGFNIVILLAFAVVFFLLATYKFGRNNDARNFV